MMQLFSSWTGGDFLLFYIMLLALSGLAAWCMPLHLRHPGRRTVPDDLESIALLAGGRERVADSLLANLYVSGALVAGEKGRLVAAFARPELPESHAARELLTLDAPITLSDARNVIKTHAERITARLQRAGLLLRPEEHARLRWLSISPFAALFALGLYRQRAGSAVGEPTGLLVALLVLTGVLAIIRFVKTDPRTVSGIAAVKTLKERNGRFERAPRADEAAMAVALFGTGVLVGTPWEPVHAMRQKESDSSGGGDGGGSESGGDGGGGCGGCGG